MRKNIKLFILVMICTFLCANKAKAESTNYSGGTVYKSSKECTENYCIVDNNTNYIIVQARLYYLNVSDLENIGTTYYFVNTNAYNYLKNYDVNLIEITAFNSYSGENRYQNAVNYLTNNYLNNETKGKEMLNKLIGFNDYTSVLIKDIRRNSGSTQGYRILLEPALVVSNVMGETNTALITGKGMASLDSTKLSTKIGTYYNQMMKIFDSNVADSNTSLFNGTEVTCKEYNNQTLSDYKVKCLYKMYNVDNYISPSGNYTCYGKTIDTDGEIKCTNWDKNNDVTYTEKYTSYQCNTTISERKRSNIYGKTILEDIGTCRLYCKEKATISLPGNITISRQKGTYFAWPTIEKGSNYRLNVKTTMECTIVDDGGGGSTTTSATMTRSCAAGTYNHPTNPDKCISNATTAKVCDLRVTEQVGNTCYTLVNPTSTKASTTESTNERLCQSGWATVAASGNKACRYQAAATCATGWATVAANGNRACRYSQGATCQSGWATVGTSGNRACRYSQTATCPYGYSPTGQSGNNACVRTEYTSTRVCAAGWLDKGDGRCMAWSTASPTTTPTACPSGYMYVDSTCWQFAVATTSASVSTSTSPGYYTHTYGHSGGTCEPACGNMGGWQVNTRYCNKGTSDCCCEYVRSSTWHPGTTTTTYTCPGGYTNHQNGVCTYCSNPHTSSEAHGDGWGNSVNLNGYCNVGSTTGSCPKGELYYYMSGNIPIYRCKNVCPDGYFYSNGQCLKDVYIGKTACPSGYTKSGNNCIKQYYSSRTVCPYGFERSGETCYKYQSKTECPYGYERNGETCYKYQAKTVCPYGYTERVDSTATCYKYQEKTECPRDYYKSGSACLKNVDAYCGPQTNKNYNYAIVNGQKYCCPSGSVKTANYSEKCRSTSATQNKICPYNDGKQYYTPDTNSTSVCRVISNKENIKYTCPEGFSLSGTTCTNDCTATVKENFKTRMEQRLNSPNTYALLTVEGSTRKINDPLIIYDKEVTVKDTKYQNGQLKSFTFDTSLYLKNAPNINRYFNKITREVSDVAKEGFYDRGQGVISILDGAKAFSTETTIKDYKLEISDIKNIGADNSFDSLTNNKKYTCNYRIIDKQECKCQEGTKNSGDNVYELYASIIFSTTGKKIAANTDVTYSCTELQKTYCNYGLIDKPAYCTDCSNNKVNITACMKDKLKNVTYEEAYNICSKQECKTESCNNYCTKNCRYIDKQIGNTIYSIQKCNGDSETCNFELRCKDDIETSQSYVSLLSEKLNTTNIVKSLKNGLSTSNLESAIRSLDTNICGIRKNSKVIYREVDLENPFPAKDGESRTAGENFNSISIINEVIKNGRGAIGNTLYNKDPILTISLTPNVIKQIREYNSKHKYTDNTLTCNGEDVAGCISKFIHGETDSLKSMGILNGISNCTNLSETSSLSAFNSCYNSNN